jgi:hypothetical protein
LGREWVAVRVRQRDLEQPPEIGPFLVLRPLACCAAWKRNGSIATRPTLPTWIVPFGSADHEDERAGSERDGGQRVTRDVGRTGTAREDDELRSALDASNVRAG